MIETIQPDKAAAAINSARFKPNEKALLQRGSNFIPVTVAGLKVGLNILNDPSTPDAWDCENFVINYRYYIEPLNEWVSSGDLTHP